MNASIEQLVSWLERDFHLATPINEEEVLQARDQTSFDEDWASESCRLDKRMQRSDFPPDVGSAIKKAREIAFKKVFAATGSHELSACASDDFDLVAKAMICDEEESDFIQRLRESYQANRIAT